jgi:hypothetical protein
MGREGNDDRVSDVFFCGPLRAIFNQSMVNVMGNCYWYFIIILGWFIMFGWGFIQFSDWIYQQ